MKISKSKTDKVFLGVCGGISKYLDVDSPWIRLGFIIGAIFSGSILLWIYLILGLILPIEDK